MKEQKIYKKVVINKEELDKEYNIKVILKISYFIAFVIMLFHIWYLRDGYGNEGLLLVIGYLFFPFVIGFIISGLIYYGKREIGYVEKWNQT